MDRCLEKNLRANTIENKKEVTARRTKEGRRLENRIPRLRSWLKIGKKRGNHRRREGIPLTAETREELIKELKSLEKESRRTPNLEVRPKIGFLRYADDYLGILQKHSKAAAMAVKTKIGAYLETHVQLEQSEEKPLVSHPTDTIKFLGYELTSKGRRRKGLRLNIPKKAIDGILTETERLCRLHHSPEADLLIKGNAIVRGWMNYSRYASAPPRVFSDVCSKIFWQISPYLAARPKTSIPTIMRKYGGTVTMNGRTRQTLTKLVNGKPINLWLHPPRTESIYKVTNGQREADAKPQPVQEWATGRSIEDRIEALEAADYQCSYCGTTEEVEVHHIGGLRNLQTAKQKSLAGQAKQKVTLCRSCHKEIGHQGSFVPRNRDKRVA